MISSQLSYHNALVCSALLTGILSFALIRRTATQEITANRAPPSIDEGRVLCGSTVVSMLASIIVGLRCGHAWLASSALCVGLASFNYWRKPEWGLRRDVDITGAATFLSLHVFLAFRPENHDAVVATYAVAMSFFAIATTSWACSTSTTR